MSPGDVMYSMVILVNNTVLYTWKLLIEYILNVPQQQNGNYVTGRMC